MLTELMTRPATISRPVRDGGTDARGNATTTPLETEVLCELQQTDRSEDTAAGTVASTTWDFFAPPGTDLRAGDTVIVDGTAYAVHGPPWVARDPETGESDHVEATLVLAQGAERPTA